MNNLNNIILTMFIFFFCSCRERSSNFCNNGPNNDIDINKRYKIKWEQIEEATRLECNHYFAYKSKFTLYTKGKLRIPISGASIYTHNNEFFQITPSVSLLNKYISERNEECNYSIKEIKALIAKSQIFYAPTFYSMHQSICEYKPIYYCDGSNYCLEKMLYIYRRNNDSFIKQKYNCLRINDNLGKIDPDQYKSLAKEMIKAGINQDDSTLKESINETMNIFENYLTDLELAIKRNKSNEYVIIPTDALFIPNPIFIFNIDSSQNGIIVKKGLLNPELFYNRTPPIL